MAWFNSGCAKLPMQMLGWKKWASGRVELRASSPVSPSLGSCTQVEVGRGISRLDLSEA